MAKPKIAQPEVTSFKFTPAQLDWIAALRGNRYKQTREDLQASDGYCCLGVGVCRANLKGKVNVSRDTSKFLDGGDLGDQPGVQEYLGLRSDVGHPDKPYTFRGKEVTTSLINLNDEEGASFKEIADVLENNPEAFFVCPPEQLALAYIRDLEASMKELTQVRTELYIAITLATDAATIYENAADLLVLMAKRELGV